MATGGLCKLTEKDLIGFTNLAFNEDKLTEEVLSILMTEKRGRSIFLAYNPELHMTPELEARKVMQSLCEGMSYAEFYKKVQSRVLRAPRPRAPPLSPHIRTSPPRRPRPRLRHRRRFH